MTRTSYDGSIVGQSDKDEEKPSAEQTKEYRDLALEIIKSLQDADQKMDKLMQGSFKTDDERLDGNMQSLWKTLSDIVFDAKFMLLQGPKNG